MDASLDGVDTDGAFRTSAPRRGRPRGLVDKITFFVIIERVGRAASESPGHVSWPRRMIEMTRGDHVATWKTYQSAWSDIGDAERRGMLETSVSDACRYTDPTTAELLGRDELVEKIRASARTYPGVSFRNDRVTELEDRAFFEWTMYDANAVPMIDGASYGEFDGDGRLSRMSGFFASPRPGGTPTTTSQAAIAWDVFQASWAMLSSAQRQALLSLSVTVDAVYRDAATTCRGVDEIAAYVEQFQRTHPGTWFRQTSRIEHHGQALSRWERVRADGSAPTRGASYVRFGSDGRVIEDVGFATVASRPT